MHDQMLFFPVTLEILIIIIIPFPQAKGGSCCVLQ